MIADNSHLEWICVVRLKQSRCTYTFLCPEMMVFLAVSAQNAFGTLGSLPL